VALAQIAQPLPFAPGSLKVEGVWQYNRWLGRWRRQSPALSGEADLSARPEAARAMPFDDSDQTLVERVKAGDVRAFEMLHRRYHPRIYRFAFLRLGNAEDAADVAANTFCKALSSLHSFQFGRTSSLYPWVHRIASNLVVDVVRAQPPGGMLSLDAQAAEDVDSFLDYLPADGPSPQELVERSEIQEVVRQAINQLPADQAKAIAMRFLGDLSIKEIAHALDRSEGAVKSLLHRALEGMRGHLKATVAASRDSVPVMRQSELRQKEKAESNVPEVVQLRPRDS
jgi:RNA polymerase sigma-70 factor (ECF subfamily)